VNVGAAGQTNALPTSRVSVDPSLGGRVDDNRPLPAVRLQGVRAHRGAMLLARFAEHTSNGALAMRALPRFVFHARQPTSARTKTRAQSVFAVDKRVIRRTLRSQYRTSSSGRPVFSIAPSPSATPKNDDAGGALLHQSIAQCESLSGACGFPRSSRIASRRPLRS
jgi:hypothetical protein